MNTHHLLTTRGPAGCIRPFIWLLLWLSTTGFLSAQGFLQQTGAANPFNNTVGSNGGLGTSPTLADLDGDGDLDLLNVAKNGPLFYYRNTGTKTTPAYTSAPSPIGQPSEGVQDFLEFQFGDLDGDGDLDAVTGNSDGVILSYRNTGSKTNPVFVQLTGASNIFAGYDFGSYSAVSLADFDGDGDLDLLSIGDQLHYLRNTGSATTPVYTDVTGAGNPFAGIVQPRTTDIPSVGDVDGDGDLDLAVSRTNTIDYYQNTGSKTSPVYVRLTGAANPFNGFSVDIYPAINLGDVDGDGDADAVVGYYGTRGQSPPLIYLKNVLHLPQQPTPASQTVCVGGSVNTTVLATGDGPITYQWYRNAQNTTTPVPNQTSATLTLTNVQAGDAGLYYARATGGGGTLFSTAFTLTVQSVGITQQPVSGSSVCVGTTVTTSVSTTGTVTGYQWYRDGGLVSGQTSATLTLPNTTTAQSGSYRAVVTGSCNSVTSTAFNLTVNPLSPEQLSLTDLYNSTNGPNWTRKDNWLTGCTPCSWYGVSCDGNGRVTGLALPNNQLSGPLSASLGNLTSLQSLIVNGNQLTGSLPASLSALTQLQFFQVDFNQFTGNIPAGYGNLTNLQILNLSQNQLSGPIPASLGNITNLQQLYLNNNQLSGCFPASLSVFCGRSVNLRSNPGLPDGGDLEGFCSRGTGSDAFGPLATASPNPVCVGNPVSLSVSAGTSYQWSGPAGFTAGNQTPGFSSASVANSGVYSVTVGNGSATCTATASVSLTVNPLPVVSITNLASAYCKDAPAVTLTGTPEGGSFTVDGSSATQLLPGSLTAGPHTVGYSFTSASGCSATTSQSLTINALPVVAITNLGSAYCQDAAAVTLTGTPSGGSFTIDGAGATSFNPASLAVGERRVNYRYTDANGCSSTATQSVSVKAIPPAPTLLTQSGGSYPASQSAVTVDLNSGTVNLVVGGCNGTIAWNGPGNTSGSGSTINVPTSQPGTFAYQASCTVDGCISPLGRAVVTVAGRLTVLHRDVDNYATNNAVQPVLVVQNQGSGALPLSALTLRYYLTVEGSAALSNLFVNYAQVGNGNVRLRYVPLSPVQQGAGGYVEVSFTAGAGSLAGGANSGPIQAYFAKGDYGTLNEADDYSYNPVRDQLTSTLRITAYYNGVLIAGIEPGSTTQIRALRALTESKNGPSATQINTFLEVRNEGNVPINYSDLKVRYYFTADGNERLQVEVDEGQVRTQLVKLSTPLAGADTYLELSFTQGGQLAGGASTGLIRYRILKPDGGRFNQANDYSYQEQPQDRSQNPRVVVLVGQEVMWGTPPSGANARVATGQEPGTELQVTLLGNPVRGDMVKVQIKGAGGEPLQLQLVNAQGRVIAQRQVVAAQAVEQHELSLAGQAPGVFLVQVSTPTQSRTIRVLKAE